MTSFQIKTPTYDFIRDRYLRSSDRFKLTDEQIKEVLSYKNISEQFTYCDWYGSETPCTATVISVQQDAFGDLIFNVETSISIPKHYCPTLLQIMGGKNLLCPTGSQRL